VMIKRLDEFIGDVVAKIITSQAFSSAPLHIKIWWKFKSKFKIKIKPRRKR
jgi:hypothetical protein